MKPSRPYLAVSTLALAAAFILPSAKAETITCESRNGGYQSCAVDTRGGVTLSRQLSSQGCWQNDTWGYDRNRIWVNNGCRAQFDVGNSSSSGNKSNAVAAAVVVGLVGAAILASNKNKRDRDDDRNDNWGGPRNTFQCESQDNRFTYCNNGRVRGQVEVYRQLSRNSCSYGQSWGVDGGRVWVDKGCRAEFAVY
ncbi:MAG: DUF3011 domain-containing protein [Pseudoxanthomonas sp.]